MPMKTNPDGTIDVRVVLTVTVDPHRYVVNVMEVEDANQKELRDHVKRTVRDMVAEFPFDGGSPFRHVEAQGIY